MKVTKAFNFSYGHVLPNHHGKCRNLHGHNACLEVTVEGDVSNETGTIIDFGDLKRQERMTQQIADALKELLDPLGVGVVVEAQHLCCGMRGIKKPNVRMTTSAMFGCFRDDQHARNEFLSLIGK